ncbi:MAG: family 16 glycosylhydrolase [Polyangiaceae bacterium]
MFRKLLTAVSLVIAASYAAPARAVSSAELYQNQTFTYGRFEARIRFAAGDGVVSSFFLWKPGSEVAGTFWNELDFEKLGADCRMQTNPLYGLPVADHGQIASLASDLCGEYHTYTFEWTPTYIAWLIDGVEVRREVGEAATAFELNAATGMQIHFNVWPGDATFGGNFDPTILPVQQYISWVQYSSLSNGTFVFEWREEFAAGTLPPGWAVGTWASPKNYSTHAPPNVTFAGGAAVLSLTADDLTGFTGEPPPDDASEPGPSDGAGGGSAGAAGGMPGVNPGAAGSATSGGSGGSSGAATGAGGGGATPMNGAGGAGVPTFVPVSSNPPSSNGCSLGANDSSRAARELGLVAGLVLALRRRRLIRQRPAIS